MPDPQYLLAAVLVASAITWALRAVPFALLAPLRHSELIRFLGDHSPVGVMIALVG
jgi:branched-subunit amino acid transport protein AzlD